MYTIFLFIQVIVSILLILSILLQSSKNDGLSGLSGGNTGSMPQLMSNKSSANAIQKITIILAILFMSNSLILANLYYKEQAVSEQDLVLTKLHQEDKQETAANETMLISDEEDSELDEEDNIELEIDNDQEDINNH